MPQNNPSTELKLEKICDNLVYYWHSLNEGAIITGLITAMRSLATLVNHEGLNQKLVEHDESVRTRPNPSTEKW
jgi:hypothetical protein